MPVPNEWDLILGNDPSAQAQMLSNMLRNERTVGDLVGLTGGRSFGGWGKGFSENAAQDQARMGQIAQFRAQKAQQAQQFAQQQALHAQQLAQTKGFQDAQIRNWEAQRAEDKRRHDQEMAWRMEMARAAQARAAAAGAKGAGFKDLPPEVRKELDTLDQQQGDLLAAAEALKSAPDAFHSTADVGQYMPWGVGKKAIQAFQNNVLKNPKEVGARATVFTLPVQIIHQIFGSAFTATEEAKAMYLPQENDSAANIAVKLANIGQAIERKKKGYFDNYAISPDMPRARPGPGGAAALPPGMPPEYRDYLEQNGIEIPDLGAAPIPPPYQGPGARPTSGSMTGSLAGGDIRGVPPFLLPAQEGTPRNVRARANSYYGAPQGPKPGSGGW